MSDPSFYWLYIILIIVLVGISAVLTAIRSAVRAVSRLRIRYLVEQDNPSAKTLEKLLAHPSRFMSSLILIDNAANIGAVATATLLVDIYLHVYVVLISTIIMTFLILVFGEIVPRTYGVRNAEGLALRSAGLLNMLSVILSPFSRLFIAIANVFVRLFGGKAIKEIPVAIEEEMGLSHNEEEGVFEEQELIHSIFVFGDTIVREVMVPRIDMVAVDVDAPIEEVLAIIIHEGHSRIPVYEDTVDNIIGIIYAKDILIQMSKGTIDVPLRQLMRPVYYVPELKKVNELLRELQKKRLHMAVVVDEYGGTAGLVTIEDLLEEIVGEIFDEYDLEETLIEIIDERTIRMDARVNINEANELLNANLSGDNVDTIGGFVYGLFSRIPSSGEEARFNGLTFRVEKVIGRRISKVLITKEEAPTEEGQEAG
ncbi:MAG TPA: hemolysin family protein [Candidatus Aquicultor sp.]